MPEPLRPIGGFPRLTEAERDFRDGKLDAAAAQVMVHLREYPNEPRGVAMLGRVAMRTGALVQAEQFLRRAIALGATDLEVQRDLATAIYQQDRLGEALNAFTFLEQRISDPQLSATRANILDKLGRNAEALAAHRAVLDREPDNVQFWILYGHSLRAGGDTDAAIGAYRRAVEIDDERGEAWWALADIKSKVLTTSDIAQMDAAVARAVDVANIVPLHMALGRAWQDAGNPDKAFDHYVQGNRLRSETFTYRAAELTEEVDEFVRDFGPDFFGRNKELHPPGPVPVFLISMPRAGSTLLEQMLDQHPQIEAVGELPYIRSLLHSALEIHMRSEAIKVPQLVARLSDRERQAFGADYLQRASLHRRTDAPFFVDKMPMNWSDLLFIRQILPQARFIEIRRNAMDCCLSNFVHYFSRAHAASFDLGDIGRFYVDYVRLMDHLDAVAPGMVHRIRYEALVEDPEPQLRGAFDYLGLPWEPAALRFYESDRVVRTPSAEQVRRPLNKAGMGAWRPYAEWLGPLREALGPLADA